MIIYIGNMLSKHGCSFSFIEQLHPKLKEKYDILAVSDKLKYSSRLSEMLYMIFKNRSKLDLVLIDTFSTKAFYYCLFSVFLCKRYNIPYIPIVHGGNFEQRFIKSPRLTNYIFGTAKSVVVPSQYLISVLSKYGYDDVEFIPNFLNIENYNFKNRSVLSPKLFWLRAFHNIYNPEMAIKVLHEVKKKYPEASLCMVGSDKDGTMHTCKVLTKELGLKDDVTFTGYLTKNAWINLSKEYSIFINTTNLDNHPVSVIEAMALGFPVISTNPGGIPNLIQDRANGLLVQCNDVADMVAKIIYLLENPIISSELSHSARRSISGLSWSVLKPKWYSLIDNVLEK